ncbi:hypothetical protein BDZ97DRAFT_1667231 [Flammula alnicola]|nr:hypothetical protein BDZ97DRAFT_1667231 [Flammula alnicola]
MIDTNPPTRDESLTHYRALEYILWSDKVECQLNVKVKEVSTIKTHCISLTGILSIPFQGLVEGIFGDPDDFTLYLKVHVPPTAGFLAYYSESPTIVIAKYTGEKGDTLAPGWIQLVAPESKFWQSRPMMLDFMLHFAMHLPENERVLERVRAWCRAISVPASGLSTSVWGRKYFEPVEPRNMRRRKPRASDLSAEESKRLRLELNDGSPLRRSKRLKRS